ncbi:hypothetical protein ES677_10290 [Bizionia gelidisalsuginis]|uniref:Chromosome partitioning protein ParA n=1 Tax=Bizionia gelidisalsuginis TaxID=291188 RepID=A0ABY3M967_9FLAO|nr:hypothetical protein [Bizionia gelidisalsuginis]TYC11295.1 hypothetical protein ES677_10290 [Bizionia gelidisalsuginis]
MIVNPQFFNYRIIISSLVIAVVILSGFAYVNYSNQKQVQTFIEQENTLIENELSEMLSRYDVLEIENGTIKSQLKESRRKLQSILDSVKSLEPNAALISRYKAQLIKLKLENASILTLVKNLEKENDSLLVTNKKVETSLAQTKTRLKRSAITAITLKKQNNTLEKKNGTLEYQLVEAKRIRIVNMNAEGVKRIARNRIVNTRRASKIKNIHVSFTMQANKFAAKGDKNIYIQVLDPQNNIVSNKAEVNFNEKSLIYSRKEVVDYRNNDLEVSTFIDINKDKDLVKGTYFISVFYDVELIGSTSMELK